MNSENLDRLLADMRKFSLERMLFGEPSDDVLLGAVAHSTQFSPVCEPTLWVTLLVKLRAQFPAVPRVPWTSLPHLIREYWLLRVLSENPNTDVSELPWKGECPVLSPLEQTYLLGLTGTETGYAKERLEATCNPEKQLRAFESANAVLATTRPPKEIRITIMNPAKLLEMLEAGNAATEILKPGVE